MVNLDFNKDIKKQDIGAFFMQPMRSCELLLREHREDVMKGMATVLLAITVFGFLGEFRPAHADWSWRSAALWSYSSADCTGVGRAAQQSRFAFGNTSAVANCGNASAGANAFNDFGGGGGSGDVVPGTVGSFGPDPVVGPVAASILASSFTVGQTGLT